MKRVQAQFQLMNKVELTEKSLHYVGMGGKVLDGNKEKKVTEKVNSHCFKLHRSFKLPNVDEIFQGLIRKDRI